MNDAASSSLPLDDNARDPRSDTKPGDAQEVRWEVVAEMPGLLPARIVADRLQAEGIPARAWQESVGQAFGMVFGPLGTGFVSVPEEFFDAAIELLAQADELEDAPDDLDDSGDEP